MRAGQNKSLGFLAALLLILVACQDFQPTKRSGFKGKYMLARGALEEGSYARAIRNYQVLLKQAGPFEPRMRLEYAHSLLRDDRFADAAREARLISSSQSGDARLAALAVQGTADHEMARAAMIRGETGDGVKSRLRSAGAALDEVLKKADIFDPIGSIAQRRKVITTELNSL